LWFAAGGSVGEMQLSGTNGSLTLQNSANSTAAFTVENTGTNAVLTVDTNSTNNRVVIGTGTGGESTPKLLVLDSGTSSSDPTAVVNGAMYYNSANGTFRCATNGNWNSCTGLDFATDSQSSSISATSETSFGQPYTIPTNDCQPGVVYQVTAGGYYKLASTASVINIYLEENAVNLVSDGAQEFNSAAYGTYVTTLDYEWFMNATITCYSTTSVMVTSEVVFGTPGANLSNTSYGTGYTTTATWANNATLTMAGAWTTGTAGTLVMNQFNVVRLGTP
jgi:hypothetical protein